MVLKLWADVKYHVPTGFGFSPKASGFYPFGDATVLAGEGGVRGVVWLIQASASNHKPKGRFFWFIYAKGIPKEPSLWFAFGLWFMWFAWNQTYHNTNDRCEALASLKGCFLCFCFSSPVFIHWIYISIATVKFSIYYVKNHRRMRSKVHPPALFMSWIFTDIFELLSLIQEGLECVPGFRHSCR